MTPSLSVPAARFAFDAASFATYRLTGVGAEHALTLSLVQHVCYLIPMLGVGYVYGGMRVFKELRNPAASP